MKTYKIREGFSFVMDDNTVKIGGDLIDVEDDVAANHSHKLELVDSPTADKPAATKDQADPAKTA
ncbi:hypothetical protein QN372_00795 [Undibacterium sp. RTI2.1]|uniref:hypothetical protein n=1 Tax=unclassified Undibacterium TaxID=2630295 RepID=UPI002AB39B08|nr:MULTISPECIES: hypothetical protein [unclassified Undibacterium]MDY7537674.1 hypothetical protein [Undibacterium sp. 5I1]MEB0029276.1 hypothetical protein [Undibacterium sp. RTI2.1]MEB0115584.1 hypothetical protein [Undibacterium sp. RTI2.2]MEB0256411.1 hypothetical protein [Undibacterium sp. 5I1]